TINGYGERCGNLDLVQLIATLQLKLEYQVLAPERLRELRDAAHFVAAVANLNPDPHAPYVGRSAFAHKGGIHVAAVAELPESYQHVDPALVGNEMRVVVSELAGRRDVRAQASVTLRVAEAVMRATAEGAGPVNALDRAVRQTLVPHYPQLAEVHLVDYKVRIVDEHLGTAAKPRVVIESARGDERWST